MYTLQLHMYTALQDSRNEVRPHATFLFLKVIEAIGGVSNAVCASFLSQLEIYDEEVGLVSKTNTQQHRCMLFPIAGLFSSTMILKISAG